ARLDFSAAGHIHDHLLSERAHLHIEIRHQLFGNGELQVDYADFESLMFRAHFVSAHRETDETVIPVAVSRDLTLKRRVQVGNGYVRSRNRSALSVLDGAGKSLRWFLAR